jgi:hypothetical protein
MLYLLRQARSLMDEIRDEHWHWPVRTWPAVRLACALLYELGLIERGRVLSRVEAAILLDVAIASLEGRQRSAQATDNEPR